MGRAGTWALGTSPPVVSCSHTAVANAWVPTIKVSGFTGAGTTKEMTHGSTEIRTIGATSFTATDFLGVAYIANRLFSEVGVAVAGSQSL